MLEPRATRTASGMLVQSIGLLILFSSPVDASSIYDVHYTMTRAWDPVLNEYYTVFDNINEVDSTGHYLHTSAIPIYARDGAHLSVPLWLAPGYSVEVRPSSPGSPGGFGSVKKDPVHGDNNPPDKDRVSEFPPHNFKSATQVISKQGNIQYAKAVPGAQFVALPGPGSEIPKGCYYFKGVGPVSFTVDGPLSGISGDGSTFSGLFLINGDSVPTELATAAPGLDVGTFAGTYWYIGDYTFSSTEFGSGYGTVDVQCNINNFMSAATSDAYVGCIPEPDALPLVLIGVSCLAGFQLLRSRRNGLKAIC